ncbi:MAG: redoxin domain-containing protein [Planctomycetales bacterium]|nr:redoxin domain-containing protein [Planctomycetales bacterium]
MRRFLNLLLIPTLLVLSTAIAPQALCKEVEPLKIGSAAPDFDLPGVDGKRYSLKDFAQSKILVVLFTCNHCPTAQAYEDRIEQLYADYHDRDVALIAVSPNSAEAVRLDELGYTDLGDSLADMKIRAKDRDFQFPYVYDGQSQEMSAEYGVLATPHVFIFDEKRILQYAGRIDDGEVTKPTSHDARNALDELLANKKVSVPETRVFGCSTKWADKKQSALDAIAKWDQEDVQLQVVKPDELRKRLTEKSDKYRLVNVWATWCAPCVAEMDQLVTIHRMYRKRHFEVITVSADTLDSKDRALVVLQDKHCSASNYILDSEKRDDLFEAVDPEWKGAVPYTALISPEGKVVHRIHGEFDDLELKREIVKHIGRTYADRK